MVFADAQDGKVKLAVAINVEWVGANDARERQTCRCLCLKPKRPPCCDLFKNSCAAFSPPAA
jgi:hypothetical protein